MMDKRKKVIILTFCIFFIFLFSGCDFESLNTKIPHKYPTEELGISINEYFGVNISSYQEVFIDGWGECLSGECPTADFENKTYVRECYFCDSPILKENRLDLISDHYSSGSSDTSFGCTRKYSGEEKKGFEILEKRDDFLKVKGEIITYFTQSSFLCDKSKDPECDDYVYGRCDGEDHKQKYVREVYLIFNKT